MRQLRENILADRLEGRRLARKLLAALDDTHGGDFFAGRKTLDASAFAELADWCDYTSRLDEIVSLVKKPNG